MRGKEIKATEFRAKVNKIQIDGINFIEHLSFNAFNEGTRLKNTIFKAQALTKVKTKIFGSDAIYATNANRNFITKTKYKPILSQKQEGQKTIKKSRRLEAS